MLAAIPFSELNGLSREVNVNEDTLPVPPTMYAVDSGGRLKMLMERTGTGQAITSRGLAEATGVAHGTIGALMSGAQRAVPEDKAKVIATVLGVDLLVLFVPLERAGRSFIPAQAAV